MVKTKISAVDKIEYKEFIKERGIKLFLIHLFYIVKDYFTISKEERRKAYIGIYYDCADFPILTILTY